MSRARDLADGTFSGSFSADSPTLVVDDANNRVGAGIASPSAPLHVAADSSTLSLRISGRSSDDRSDVEFYENDNTTKLTGFTNEPGYSLWSYGTRSIYTDSDAHIFRNGSATTLARLDSDGLKFNGDTAAANALDDYEEGEHTATVTPATSGSVSLYNSSNTLSYTKIGRMVHVNGWIQVYSVSSPVGAYVKVSLPFVPADLTDVAGRAGGAQCFSDASAGTITAKGAYTPEGEAAVYIYQDASTLATGDDFIIDINYNTS